MSVDDEPELPDKEAIERMGREAYEYLEDVAADAPRYVAELLTDLQETES